MKPINKIKKIKPYKKRTANTVGVVFVALFAAIAINFIFNSHAATPDAAFSLSPSSGSYTVGSSFSVTVYETSQTGDNVEGVQANLSYNAADLQLTSASVSGSPFSICAQGQDPPCSSNGISSGSIKIAEASGSPVSSGQQLIATLNFTVIGASAPNPTSVSIASGSDIENSSEASIWNGALTSASFTLTYPPPSVSINSPADSSSVHGKTLSITSTATANDNGSIINAKLYVNNTLTQTLTSSPYNFTLDTTGYSDGNYTLKVQATDDQSNTTSQSVSVNITNGDFNGDGIVGLSDLIILAQNYGKTGTFSYSQGNITGTTSSPEVGLPDLIILAQNYGYNDGLGH